MLFFAEAWLTRAVLCGSLPQSSDSLTRVCICVFPSAVVYHRVWACPRWHRRTLCLPVLWIGCPAWGCLLGAGHTQGLGTRAHGASSAG